MKFFGWKSAGREASRPVLLRGLSAGFRGEWPRSFEGQVRELYLENVVAQRAVRLVAEGVASAPLSASDGAARVLVLTTSGGQSLLETVATQLLLHGNAYVEILSGSDGRPAELYALRPERVSVEADARGWPVAFRYRAGEAVTRMPADQIIHIRTHHPLDDHYGLGCLGAAAGAIAAHNSATKWNKALLDNAARPSGALVTEGAEPLSGDQFERLKAELEASFAGDKNAGKPMLLEGGLRWQSLSLSPADMDFAGLKAASAREIALAFGVPPMLLGLPGDATYANYREANRALWRLAILPLAGKILDAIAQGLRPWFAGLTLSVDPDQVGALSEERERLWAQVNAAGFLSTDEKRALVGYGAVKGAGGAEAAGTPAPDVPPAGGAQNAEAKYNHNHDPRNGQFTYGLSPSANFSDSVTVDLRTGVQRHRNGSITIPLDPPTVPQPARHYQADAGVVIPPHTEPKVNEMARQFREKTGKTLTVLSGRRTSLKQARAMYDKFASGNPGNDYRNRVALKQIRDAYLAGRKAEQSREITIAQMRQVIDSQVRKGTYISLHMTGQAVDIKTVGKGYSSEDRKHLRAAAISQGGQFHPEGIPAHIHVQFPPPRKRR